MEVFRIKRFKVDESNEVKPSAELAKLILAVLLLLLVAMG